MDYSGLVWRQQGRRGPSRIRLLLVGVAATLVATALPAWGARVLEVRTGQHDGFSRIVFELDSPVGYKVERSTPPGGGSELVVSIDAGADPKTISKKLDFIEKIEIRSDGSRSTAHISLVGSGLKLKEMILSNPPRIVLDLLDERAPKAPVRAANVHPKAKVKPKANVRSKANVQSKAKGGAGTTASVAPRPKSTTRATAGSTPDSAIPSRSKSTPRMPSASQRSATVNAQPPASLADGGPGMPSRSALLAMNKPKPAVTAPPAIAKASPLPTKHPVPQSPSATRSRLAPASALGSAPGSAPKARPKLAATARPRVSPPVPASAVSPNGEGLLTTTNVMLAGLALVLLAGGGGLLWRRRGGVEVMAASELEQVSDEDNPFAGLDAKAADGDDHSATAEALPENVAGEAIVEGIAVPDDESVAPESVPTQTSDTPNLTGDDASPVQSEGADMNMESISDGSATTIMTPPPPPMGASDAGSGDVAQMISEFERRMAGMEKRIDEFVDAKERLERQVAAQTEELRVQRAAIARTQRAVRNMNRSGEDSPTEPALRDPSRPEGPRE